MQKRILAVFTLFCLIGCIADEVGGVYLLSERQDTLYAVAKHGMPITFNAGGEWTATTTADWLTIDPGKGTGGRNSLMVWTASANKTKQDRMATLTIQSGGVSEEIHFVQRSDFALFDEPYYEIPAEGGTLDITFSTNVERKNLFVSYLKLTWVEWQEENKENTRAEWNGRLKPLAFAPNDSSKVRRTFFVLGMYSKKQEFLPLDTTWVQQLGAQGDE